MHKRVRTLHKHGLKFVTTKWKWLVAFVIIILLIEAFVQLFYPTSQTLPYAKLGGQDVGGMTKNELAATLQGQLATYRVTFAAGDNKQDFALGDIGATVDTDVFMKEAYSYPIVYRLLPFSIFWYKAIPSEYSILFQDEVLQAAADKSSEPLSSPPVDASIEVDGDGNVVVTSAKNGYVVAASDVMAAAQGASYLTLSLQQTIVVDAPTEEPAITDSDVEAVKVLADGVLDQSIKITLEDETITPSRADIAEWIAFSENDDGTLSIKANAKAITAYVDELNKSVYEKPTNTVITIVDGQETGRKAGTEGKSIDTKALVESLKATVTDTPSEKKVVAGRVIAVASPIVKSQSYTESYLGLKAYVADITADGSIKISLQQIGGSGWSVDGGAWDSFVSASTYKPYVLLRLFDDINSGKVKWTNTIAGMTYNQCFEDTIVISANTCAEALIEKYGARTLTDYLHGRGFSSGTGFTFSDATHTTAGDLTRLMVGVQNSTMVSGDNRTKLLDAMSRQVYRQGIPAGSAGTVYDKVGFLWDYLNDTAIVKHPKGTYVLTVLTKGHSWAKIAEITKKIEELMYAS